MEYDLDMIKKFGLYRDKFQGESGFRLPFEQTYECQVCAIRVYVYYIC